MQSNQDEALEARRGRLVADAVAGLEATHEAIDALEAKDTKRALEQLAIATGKLDLLGYGEAEETYPDLVERLEKLEASLDPESTAESVSQLAKLREYLSELGSSLLE